VRERGRRREKEKEKGTICVLIYSFACSCVYLFFCFVCPRMAGLIAHGAIEVISHARKSFQGMHYATFKFATANTK
jgi:hypothetical protein